MKGDPFWSGDIAMDVDGMARYPWDGSGYDPITRNVNPDRHARIRQKHFRYAERTLAKGYAWDQTLDRLKDACGGHGNQSGQLRVYAMQGSSGSRVRCVRLGHTMTPLRALRNLSHTIQQAEGGGK